MIKLLSFAAIASGNLEFSLQHQNWEYSCPY